LAITVGMEAPDFELKSQLDGKIRLSDYRGRRNVLVVFFPMAWTPV
jgi:peroxiredoxin